MTAMPPVREMQHAFQRRDASYDGIFFLAVRSTGIFCRPSCPARKPDPANVEYFASAREAVFAGYRPCKRCTPMEAPGTPPEWLAGLLARIDREPAARYPDEALRSLGMEPARVRRYFKKTYGMTFQAYCRGRRLGQSLQEIRTGADLDDVALGHGYASHSGFRGAFVQTFGRPPGQSRETECVLTSWMETPLGPLIAGATSAGICLLEFTDRRMLEAQVTTVRKRIAPVMIPGENAHLATLRTELEAYFAGELKGFSVPLVRPGTAFQSRVWDALLKIPYGATISYEQLAHRIGTPSAQRAVGHANGMNRIAIVIPCHRVVNKDGKLGGYGGGLWRKQKLLQLERGEHSFFPPPTS
jgi:AraC family transcriptional regulator, regulatory protein of adaptative response / methylated-DNA-[protein]-cysteine methyltransferase